jgi:hypothetical protein
MFQQKAARRAWALGVVGLWIGCSNPGPELPEPQPECTDRIAVRVSSGTTPVISWTPHCTVGRILVWEGVEERWGTETHGQNIYQSPVTYGIRPPGSTEEEPAAPLFAGTKYRVELFRWIVYNPPEESLQVVGVDSFIP